MMLKYITFVISLIIMHTSNAQSNDSIAQFGSRLQIEGRLGVGWGSGNFQRNFDKAIFSFEGAFGYRIIKERYLFLQLLAGWNRLARYQTEYWIQYGNEQIDVKHSAASSLMDIKIGIKYEAPQIYYVIPFMHFEIGTRNAYLYSEIRDDDTDEVIESYRASDDWSYLYSIGAGLQVPITNTVHINIRGTFSGTGSMNILLPDLKDIPPGTFDPVLYYKEHFTTVELFHLHLGISLYINN